MRAGPELVVQVTAGPGEHLERVGLPSGAGQGRHQQPGQSLPPTSRATIGSRSAAISTGLAAAKQEQS